MQDEFGDRMKDYEGAYTSIQVDACEHLYTCVRIDGRSFSKFTRGMIKPYDIHLMMCMQSTTKALVKEFKALVGYTQSDEITLIFDTDKLMFNGKIQKIASVIASYTSAYFVSIIGANYAQRIPHFDARVFGLPGKIEAVNSVLWRVHDAKRNAISMYAQSLFSHKQLQNKSSREMLQMIAERGHDYDQIIPDFRYGSFFTRVSEYHRLNEYDEAVIKGHASVGQIVTRHTIQRANVSEPTYDNLYKLIFGDQHG